MALINAVVNAPPDIDLRIHLRQEFIRLGIRRIFKVNTIMANCYFTILS
jgi:hypothetical protein